MIISNNRVVTIEYKMVDKKGYIIDSSDHGEPLAFIQGGGSLFLAIEKKIEGHQTGERLTFSLAPEEGFGVHDKSKVKVIPRGQFNSKDGLHIGMQFFTQKNGNDLPVTITALNDDEVTVDGNHPLAGADINIDLVIVDVRDATEIELKTGKVQTDEEIYAASGD